MTVIPATDLPKNDIDTVVLNVTIVDPQGDGFASVYPCPTGLVQFGGELPLTSTLNFRRGQDVPNLVAVAAIGGRVCIVTSASAHVVADIAGWYHRVGVGFNPSARFECWTLGVDL